MKIIKINPDSVFKNKTAGKTETAALKEVQISFEYPGELPEKYKGNEHVVCATWSDEKTTGIVFNYSQELLKELTEAGFKIKVDYHSESIIHRPIPLYSYRYDFSTEIKCLNCGTESAYSDIYVWNDNPVWDDEPAEYLKCPKCGEIEDFEEIKFQKIEEYIALAETDGCIYDIPEK